MANLTVAVQDGNNINVEVTPTPNQVIVVDRGIAGVGIESVAIVYNAPNYYLEFTYTNGTTELVLLPAIASGVTSFNTRIGAVTLTSLDVTTALGYTPTGTITSSDGSIDVTTVGTSVDLAVSVNSPASTLVGQVRNQTGATLTRGTVVYISGASGNKALVSKAIATGDATSAQTYGVITADIPNNQNGYATIAGSLGNLNTIAYTDGTQLYLSSTTAGAWTSTKQYAPNHLVYVGVVTRSHATQGTIEVKIQNGYEMDELHNVSAQTPSNGNVLIWNNSTQLWQSAGITAGTGVSVTNGAGSITVASTGIGFQNITFASQVNNPSTLGAITIDWTTGNYQFQAAPTGAITYTFIPPAGVAHLQLFIAPSATAQVINFPANFYWFGAVWGGENNKASIISFYYDGTNYYAIGTNQV